MEPRVKRASFFVDGQNLFFHARAAFGHPYPNFDVNALCRAIAREQGWTSIAIRFYTGIHDAKRDPFLHHVWSAKLAQMGRDGVTVITRTLKYREKEVLLPDGRVHRFPVAMEKGIDVRIALDVVMGAQSGAYDVACLLSQDQDLAEVALDVRTIARMTNRWIRITSAYPLSPTASSARGVDRTDWIPISREMYDANLDPRDYRPKPDELR